MNSGTLQIKPKLYHDFRHTANKARNISLFQAHCNYSQKYIMIPGTLPIKPEIFHEFRHTANKARIKS